MCGKWTNGVHCTELNCKWSWDWRSKPDWLKRYHFGEINVFHRDGPVLSSVAVPQVDALFDRKPVGVWVRVSRTVAIRAEVPVKLWSSDQRQRGLWSDPKLPRLDNDWPVHQWMLSMPCPTGSVYCVRAGRAWQLRRLDGRGTAAVDLWGMPCRRAGSSGPLRCFESAEYAAGVCQTDRPEPPFIHPSTATAGGCCGTLRPLSILQQQLPKRSVAGSAWASLNSLVYFSLCGWRRAVARSSSSAYLRLYDDLK